VIQLPLGPIWPRCIARGTWRASAALPCARRYVACALSISVTLAYCVAGHWLLGLLVPGFDEAYRAMLIMCLGYVINTMTAGPDGPDHDRP
jgi:hypothetical protein